jgi:putative oxidoreductase
MKILFLLGRILVGGFFIYSGIKHFMNLNAMTGYTKAAGVPLPDIAVAGTGLLLFVAGFSFLLGYQPLIGIAAAVLFLIPVTLMMHAFWKMEGAARASNLVNFAKNTALLGSVLMFLLLPRPWPLSLGK